MKTTGLFDHHFKSLTINLPCDASNLLLLKSMQRREFHITVSPLAVPRSSTQCDDIITIGMVLARESQGL